MRGHIQERRTETLAPPSNLRVNRFRLGGREFAVLRWHPQARSSLPRSLSIAETDVIGQVLGGKSNAEIAEARGTSPRTVANQLASIFAKLGVQSRHELMAALFQAEAADAPRRR